MLYPPKEKFLKSANTCPSAVVSYFIRVEGSAIPLIFGPSSFWLPASFWLPESTTYDIMGG